MGLAADRILITVSLARMRSNKSINFSRMFGTSHPQMGLVKGDKYG